MFDPMRAFKKMHQDKCLDGSSPFAPCECECFCYSKQFFPAMFFPIKTNFTINMFSESPTLNTQPMFEKLELKRLFGPPCEDGYYSYIKSKEIVKAQESNE